MNSTKCCQTVVCLFLLLLTNQNALCYRLTLIPYLRRPTPVLVSGVQSHHDRAQQVPPIAAFTDTDKDTDSESSSESRGDDGVVPGGSSLERMLIDLIRRLKTQRDSNTKDEKQTKAQKRGSLQTSSFYSNW